MPLKAGKLNVAGESHNIAGRRRPAEQRYANKVGGNYWREKGFQVDLADATVKGQAIPRETVKGDPNEMILGFRLTNVEQFLTRLTASPTRAGAVSTIKKLDMVDGSIARDEHLNAAVGKRPDLEKASAKLKNQLEKIRDDLPERGRPTQEQVDGVKTKLRFAEIHLRNLSTMYSMAAGRDIAADYASSRMDRSIAMFLAASKYTGEGLWKIGNNHVIDIREFITSVKTGERKGTYKKELANFESRVRLMDKGEFTEGLARDADAD